MGASASANGINWSVYRKEGLESSNIRAEPSATSMSERSNIPEFDSFLEINNHQVNLVRNAFDKLHQVKTEYHQLEKRMQQLKQENQSLRQR